MSAFTLLTFARSDRSHGKWRPTLQALVQRNADKVIQDQTKDAFSAFPINTRSVEHVKRAMNTLIKLQGIGPATASLFLSVYDPDFAPFFSDELFRWCFFEDGKFHGWDRLIKYNIKEYLELFERVHELKDRFSNKHKRDIAATDMEKVSYALGKRAAGLSPGPGSKKRKAETEMDNDMHENPGLTIENEPWTTLGSKAVFERGQQEKNHEKAKNAQEKAISDTKKSKKAMTKSTTPATAASNRSKRGAK